MKHYSKLLRFCFSLVYNMIPELPLYEWKNVNQRVEIRFKLLLQFFFLTFLIDFILSQPRQKFPFKDGWIWFLVQCWDLECVSYWIEILRSQVASSQDARYFLCVTKRLHILCKGNESTLPSISGGANF